MKTQNAFKSFLTLLLIILSLNIYNISNASPPEEESNFCFKGDCDKNSLIEMHREIENMMHSFFSSPYMSGESPFKKLKRYTRNNTILSSATYPRVDVFEKNNIVNVSIEIPGIDKDKINAEVFDEYISLKYEEKSSRHKKEENNYYISERRYGSFERIIPLPEGVEIEKAEANHKNGVLIITIPKKQEAKPKSKKLKI